MWGDELATRWWCFFVAVELWGKKICGFGLKRARGGWVARLLAYDATNTPIPAPIVAAGVRDDWTEQGSCLEPEERELAVVLVPDELDRVESGEWRVVHDDDGVDGEGVKDDDHEAGYRRRLMLLHSRRGTHPNLQMMGWVRLLNPSLMRPSHLTLSQSLLCECYLRVRRVLSHQSSASRWSLRRRPGWWTVGGGRSVGGVSVGWRDGG